jgi:hypothetical protein
VFKKALITGITGQDGSDRSTSANLTRILAEVQPEGVDTLGVQWWAMVGQG